MVEVFSDNTLNGMEEKATRDPAWGLESSETRKYCRAFNGLFVTPFLGDWKLTYGNSQQIFNYMNGHLQFFYQWQGWANAYVLQNEIQGRRTLNKIFLEQNQLRRVTNKFINFRINHRNVRNHHNF